jgi:hypothetical protein
MAAESRGLSVFLGYGRPQEEKKGRRREMNPEDGMGAESGAGREQLARSGPRTPQGKLRAKYNRIHNGIFARIVLTGEPFRESKKDYAALLAALRDDIRPVGALQELLVEKLAFVVLRQSRVYKVDARIAPLFFGAIEKGLTEKPSPPVTELMDWNNEVAMIRKDSSPELLLRYETSLERQFDRILTQLERLQRIRSGQPVPPPVKVEVST